MSDTYRLLIMKRGRTSPVSIENKILRLPNDVQSVIVSKLPVHQQNQLSKIHKEVNRLRMVIFRDFLQDIIATQNSTSVNIVFENGNAKDGELKRVIITNVKSASTKSNGLFDDPYKFIENTDEYVLDLHTLVPGKLDTANFYAQNMIEHILETTRVYCNKIVLARVQKLVDEILPTIQVQTVSLKSSRAKSQSQS